MSFFHLEPVTEKLSETPETRVHGGRQANRGEVPYQVAFLNGGSLLCEGSIFNAYTVLTAAHCFMLEGKVMTPLEWANVSAVAGDHNVAQKEENDQVRQIQNVIIHPKYQKEAKISSTSDLAIVRLQKPYTYNQFVQPLPIGSRPVEAIPGGEGA